MSSWLDLNPVLEIVSCGARLPSYRLRRGRTVLGRHADSDCVIDDPHASRQQLAIEWDDERLRIEPLAPKNPVTIERVDDQVHLRVSPWD